MHVAVPTAVLPIVLRSTNKDVEVRKVHPLEFTNPVLIRWQPEPGSPKIINHIVVWYLTLHPILHRTVFIALSSIACNWSLNHTNTSLIPPWKSMEGCASLTRIVSACKICIPTHLRSVLISSDSESKILICTTHNSHLDVHVQRTWEFHQIREAL